MPRRERTSRAPPVRGLVSRRRWRTRASAFRASSSCPIPGVQWARSSVLRCPSCPRRSLSSGAVGHWRGAEVGPRLRAGGTSEVPLWRLLVPRPCCALAAEGGLVVVCVLLCSFVSLWGPVVRSLGAGVGLSCVLVARRPGPPVCLLTGKPRARVSSRACSGRARVCCGTHRVPDAL